MNYPIHLNEIRSAGIRAAMRDAGQVFARLVATGRSEHGLAIEDLQDYEILGEMEMIEIGDDGCWHISPTVE